MLLQLTETPKIWFEDIFTGLDFSERKGWQCQVRMRCALRPLKLTGAALRTLADRVGRVTQSGIGYDSDA